MIITKQHISFAEINWIQKAFHPNNGSNWTRHCNIIYFFLHFFLWTITVSSYFFLWTIRVSSYFFLWTITVISYFFLWTITFSSYFFLWTIRVISYFFLWTITVSSYFFLWTITVSSFCNSQWNIEAFRIMWIKQVHGCECMTM